MNDWWKNPVLQGDDNEYGEYDYLVNELPKDSARWEFSKYKWKCETCGKESHLRFCTKHYFYCYDGYDYMSYDECWKCRLSSNIYCFKHKVKNKIKKRIKTVKDTIWLCNEMENGWKWKFFKSNYKFAKAMNK